jgi:hypothetical protein
MDCLSKAKPLLDINEVEELYKPCHDLAVIEVMMKAQGIIDNKTG